MPADDLADLARDVFSEDQVHVAERLDEAIDLAVSLVDDADAADGALGSSAVLVTGSVVTAGDAQLLLAPAQAVGRSANPGSFNSLRGELS
jgi:dihydrofolate synthase/folylpolyglutamate synthase